MSDVSVKEIVMLAKKYDSILNRFDNNLKNVLLFTLYELPENVLPDYLKKYYKLAIEKNLISNEDFELINYWRSIRNELVHKKSREIPYLNFKKYENDFKKARRQLENLSFQIVLKIEGEEEESKITIFQSYEELVNHNYENKPGLILYIPNSQSKTQVSILNLYMIGDRNIEKSEIIKNYFYPVKTKKNIEKQVVLAQILTTIYDNLRPDKFRKLRNVNIMQSVIKKIKRIVFWAISIDFNPKDFKKEKFQLIIHDSDILKKIKLLRTDFYKDQLVGIIFTDLGYLKNFYYSSHYNKHNRIYFSLLQEEIKRLIEKFDYSDYYFSFTREKARFNDALNYISKVRKF